MMKVEDCGVCFGDLRFCEWKEHTCPYDPMSDRAVKRAQQEDKGSVRIRSLKCKKCGITVVNEPDTVDICITSCKNRNAQDPSGCGIYQVDSVIKSLTNAVKRKQLPVLLQKPANDVEKAFEWPHTKEACDDTCNASGRMVQVTTTKVPADTVEFLVDDPVVIKVDKRGKVLYEFPRE